jgi:antitoxin (DNA-binding transcriptional repressor) of toxin-antitoxin stability system
VTERRINRCTWVSSDNPLMLECHDREWGVPVDADRKHFEFLVLEAVQAGLSWSITNAVRAVASKVPSARTVGRGNWPCPHPTARLHPESVTDRQAPSPVHRPLASGPSPGPLGLP